MIGLLNFALELYQLVIILRVIVSWIISNPYNNFYQLLIRATEPVLRPIRSMLPKSNYDFSPIIAIFLLSLIQRFVLRQLYF